MKQRNGDKHGNILAVYELQGFFHVPDDIFLRGRNSFVLLLVRCRNHRNEALPKQLPVRQIFFRNLADYKFIIELPEMLTIA